MQILYNPRNDSCAATSLGRQVTEWGNTLARKQYIARQIATLLKFAKVTTDPQVAAALVEKAADLKARVDPLPDRSPQPPDVEAPPNRME